MSFKEYPHIENTYQSKEIEWLLRNRPEAKELEWVVEEKINGSNMQINIDPQGKITCGSRNRAINWSDDHCGFMKWVDEHLIKKLGFLLLAAMSTKKSFRLYGEYFGPKICKGVDYGKEKRFIVFGIMVNDSFIPPIEVYEFMERAKMEEYCIKPKQVCNSLQEALDYNPRFISEYSPSKDLAEGVVIKPYKTVILDQHGLPIYYKNKIDEFKEKQRAPSEKIPNDPAKGILLDYWNENRLNSCYSKLGKIQSKADIGKYMKVIIDDICADWQ